MSSTPPFYKVDRQRNTLEPRPPLSDRDWDTLFGIMKEQGITVVLSISEGMGPVAITSDSMRPSITTGDLVIGRPYDGSRSLGANTVVTFRNGAGSSLITHRIVRSNEDGSYETKGDANALSDSTPVFATDIKATGRFVVPLIGQPTVWARNGEWPKLALATLMIVFMLWLARFGLLNRYCPWFANDDSPKVPVTPEPDMEARDEPELVAAGVHAQYDTIESMLTMPRMLLAGVAAVALILPTAAAAMTATTNNGSSAWTAVAVWPRYLKTDGPGNRNSVAILPLSTTAPTVTTLPNYDQDRDTVAGLLIGKGGTGASETDTRKIQKWSQTLASNTTLSGTGQLTFWSAIRDFRPDRRGEVTAFLLDCLADGTGCTTFGSAFFNQDNWQQGSGTWVSKTIDFGPISRTITAGRALLIVIIVANGSADDMWFAYDTTGYPSVFNIV